MNSYVQMYISCREFDKFEIDKFESTRLIDQHSYISKTLGVQWEFSVESKLHRFQQLVFLTYHKLPEFCVMA